MLVQKSIGGTPLAREKSPRGRSSKGQHTSLTIALAAEKLLIEQGYHNFSMRRVAQTAGLTLGNLQYYFPNKDALIKAMLEHCVQRYLDRFEQTRAHAGEDPEAQFKAIITLVFKDLNQRTTTRFFPEVWSLSNHYEHAVKFMDEMYEKYRLILIEVMALINSQLSEHQLHQLALFISSSIEGHTMFIGHGKPWKHETEQMIDIAMQSFLWLIRSGKIPA